MFCISIAPILKNVFSFHILQDFEKLEEYEKKNMLQYWRNTYQNIKILKEMGISNKRFYDIVAELELPAAKRIYKKKRKASTKQAKKADEVFEAIQPAEVIMPKEVTEDPDGLHLVFKGTYKPKTIVRNLMNFIGMLEDEEDENEDFHVEIKITHKAAQK